MNLLLFYLFSIALIKGDVDEYIMEYDPNTSFFIDNKTNSDLITEFSYKYSNFDTVYIAVSYRHVGSFGSELSTTLSYDLIIRLKRLMPNTQVLFYRKQNSGGLGAVFSKKKYEVNHRGVFIYTSLQE